MDAMINPEAEMSVIGAMLQDGEAVRKARALSKQDFSEPMHQSIHIVCQRLYARHVPVDMMTVSAELGSLGSAVPPTYLLECVRFVPTTANVDHYIRIVKEASRRRKLSGLGETIAQRAGDGTQDLAELVSSIRGELSDLLSGGDDGWMTAAELASRTLERVELLQSGKLPLIKSGLPDLDYLIGGFGPGELEIIGSRPGVGKTALGVQLMLEACKAGKRVALVSQEMSPTAIGERLVSRLSGVDGGKLHRGKGLDPDDWVDVMDALNLLAAQPFVSKYNVPSIEQLRVDAQRTYDRSGLDMMVVDYVQLVKSAGRYGNRTDEVERVVDELKGIAMELDIPIIGLAQVRRSGNRVPVMPVMDELKGSGAIEQAASKIILLHRPEVEDDECLTPQLQGIMRQFEKIGHELIIADLPKHREGKTDMWAMDFDPAHMTFRCLEVCSDGEA